jgi:hypothetical protein
MLIVMISLVSWAKEATFYIDLSQVMNHGVFIVVCV